MAKLRKLETQKRFTGEARYHNSITQFRVSCGYTQQSLSDATGIPAKTIQKYELGLANVNNMTLEKALALSKAFNCHPADLL